MSFFFPNKSKCSICQLAIEEYKDAVLLGYIEADAYPELLKYARSFAHRHCFNNWSNNQDFIDASFSLVKNYNNQSTNIIGPYLSIDKNDNILRIKDYYSIFEFEIRVEDLGEIRNNFNLLISDELDSINFNDWNISKKETEYILQQVNENTIIDEIHISLNRFEEIIQFLNESDT